ncbi:hypothetical protein UFOVP141_34 [uncultured Caudovirales phage]|uniref:Uncharacterized protein n=1 Tax=uncultured Caudovirales phage TaxID=2100421 RepID=A0A6J7VJX5_9CAUD|nr:hypothetical protein UFOVP141_34 [uncultured Caudovirales phage]
MNAARNVAKTSEIAEVFGVSQDTIQRWGKVDPVWRSARWDGHRGWWRVDVLRSAGLIVDQVVSHTIP